MADSRRWVKISLDLPRHPKMMVVSVPARWLFVELLCYCSEYMTDGVVPEIVAKRLASNIVSDTLSNLLNKMPSKELSIMLSEMLSTGLSNLADRLLEELTGNGDPATLSVEGDTYVIHDYLDHQASRKDVLARQKRLREAGRRGGLAKAKQNAKQEAKRSSSKMLSKGSSKNVADKDKDIDNYPPTPNGVSPQGGKRATQKKPRKTSRPKPLPTDWEPNPTHARIALETGVNLDTEAEKFRDYLKASGKTYVDHDAAFRNWLRSPYRNNAGQAALRYRNQEDQIERMFQVAAASDLADQAATDSAEIFTLPAPTGGDAA